MPRLSVLALVFYACSADATDCDGQTCDATSLIQLNAGVAAGKQRQKDETEALVLSRSDAGASLGDRCDIAGRFQDPDGNAAFRITESLLELSIEGAPTMTHHFNEDGELLEVLVEDAGGAFASRPGSPDSRAYRNGSKALARTSFAAKGAKKLSHLLHLKDLNGGSSPCTFPFHMMLAKLNQFSQKHATEDEDVEMLQEEEASDSDMAPPDPSNYEGVTWPEDNPYGFEKECPATHQPTWKCRATNVEGPDGKEMNGAWVSPDGHDGKDIRYFSYDRSTRRRVNFGDLNDPLGPPEVIGRNIKCEQIKANPESVDVWLMADPKKANGVKPFPETKECIGLCGATCDCWESICGDEYRCNYNPYCCAHDMACVQDGYVSVRCAWHGKNVRDACLNKNWKNDGR